MIIYEYTNDTLFIQFIRQMCEYLCAHEYMYHYYPLNLNILHQILTYIKICYFGIVMVLIKF